MNKGVLELNKKASFMKRIGPKYCNIVHTHEKGRKKKYTIRKCREEVNCIREEVRLRRILSEVIRNLLSKWL